MAKHNFAPKLNEREAFNLGLIPLDWTEAVRRWQWNGDTKHFESACPHYEHLANRGLLERDGYEVRDVNGRGYEFVRFRLSRRGEKMLVRYQRQQADQQWRQKQRASGVV